MSATGVKSCFSPSASSVSSSASSWSQTWGPPRSFVEISALARLLLTRSRLPLTQGGLYIFQLFDYYACSGMTLLLFAILQSFCVGWVYGRSNSGAASSQPPLRLWVHSLSRLPPSHRCWPILWEPWRHDRIQASAADQVLSEIHHSVDLPCK